jgi:hypothetical protein
LLVFAVDHVGSDRPAALTDHIEVGSVVGEKLSVDEVGLWRRKDDTVAAGTTDYAQQRCSMPAVGLTGDDVRVVLSTVPRSAVAHRPRRSAG